MRWIKRILGITELIEAQNKTNELLKKIITLQKYSINNDCVPFSQKYRAR